jgi:hypothetical protein
MIAAKGAGAGTGRTKEGSDQGALRFAIRKGIKAREDQQSMLNICYTAD